MTRVKCWWNLPLISDQIWKFETKEYSQTWVQLLNFGLQNCARLLLTGGRCSGFLWRYNFENRTPSCLKVIAVTQRFDCNYLLQGEASWSSGERQGLRCEFNFRVHLKTRWIRWTTWWQKNNCNNIGSQKGQVTPKLVWKNIYFKSICER
jgi:hypothetical protein